MAARRTLLVVLGCCLASSVKAEEITEEEGEGRLGWDKHFPGSLSAFLCPGSTQLEVTVPQRWPSTPPRSRTRWSLDSSASCLEPSSSLSSDFPLEVSLARSLPAVVTDLNMDSRSHPSDQVITPRATNLQTHFQGFFLQMWCSFFLNRSGWWWPICRVRSKKGLRICGAHHWSSQEGKEEIRRWELILCYLLNPVGELSISVLRKIQNTWKTWYVSDCTQGFWSY